jgi:hypothetical protein
VRADDRGGKGFDAAEEFVKELVVVLFFSARRDVGRGDPSRERGVDDEAQQEMNDVAERMIG